MPLLQQPQEQPQEQDAQEAFDKFVINALNILHEDKTADDNMHRISVNKDKVDALGEISLDIVNRLEDNAAQSNFDVPINAGLNGLNVIVGELANMAQEAGIIEYTDEQKYQAFSWAVSNYLNNAVQSGKLSKDELAQAGEHLQSGGQ